jgi:hypothetical protein
LGGALRQALKLDGKGRTQGQEAPTRDGKVKAPPAAGRKWLVELSYLIIREWLLVAALDLRDPKAARDRARTRLLQLPKRSELKAWNDELGRALDGEADRQMLVVLIGVMLGGFPRVRAQRPEIYAEAAMLIVRGRRFSPDVVAAAIVRIWRKAKYPPTISEFLEECEETKQLTTHIRRAVAKMLELRNDADIALVRIEGGPEDVM